MVYEGIGGSLAWLVFCESSDSLARHILSKSLLKLLRLAVCLTDTAECCYGLIESGRDVIDVRYSYKMNKWA